jgi:hypothetical protein
MLFCKACGILLSGQKRKYCSHKCTMKVFNTKPERKLWEKNRQYGKNKYIKCSTDVLDRFGEKGTNWKGGVSKDNMRYRRRFLKLHPDIVKIECITYRRMKKAIKNGEIEHGCCIICGKTKKIEAHHVDYNQPLKIVWLCRSHHVLANNKDLEIPMNKIITIP